MQDSAANCGPASLSNALAAMGITRSQKECEALCKTSATEGTSIRGLLTGIKAVGRTPTVLNERRFDVAHTFLRHYLGNGRAAILAVDTSEHWVAAIGLLGPHVLIADPADNEFILTYAADHLKVRWIANNRYYGVIL